MSDPALDFLDEDLSPEEAEALLVLANRAKKKLRMQRSLKEFIFEAWEVLEPGRELIWNWHLDTLCGYLEAVHARKIRRLVINIPPGSMKSLVVSVFYPAWVWVNEPTHKFLCGSNEGTLATRDSMKMRQLVKSDWFQGYWGIEVEDVEGIEEEVPHLQISRDQDEKTLFQNTRLGHRQSQGILAKVTGKRADTLIWDDPHDANQTESDVQRTAITSAYDTGWANRMNDSNKSAFILIMQRLHVDDAAGHLLAKNQGFVLLAIPMEYDPDFTFDAGKDIGRPDLNDPRTEEGELLFEARFDQEAVDIEKSNLGPYGYAGQHQQQPNPKGGGEFLEEWLKYYRTKPDTGNRCILVDPAGERKPGVKGKRDFTAMGVFELGDDNNWYLIDGVRDRLNLRQRTKLLFDWHRKYDPLFVGYEQYGKDSDIAHIEDIQDREAYRFKVIGLGGAMKKEDRIRRLIPDFSNEKIWLPATLYKTLWDGTVVDIIEQFKEQEYKPFPVGKFDDFFDMMARLKEPEVIEAMGKPKKKKKKPPPTRRKMRDRTVGY